MAIFCSPLCSQSERIISIQEAESRFKFSDIFTFEGYTKLELKNDSYVFSADEVLFDSDDIFILNDAGRTQEGIIVFDRQSGQYKGRTGQQGEGPSEYRGLRDISFSNNGEEILAYDATKLSFKSYNKEGVFEAYKKVFISCTEFEVLRSGYKVLYNEFEPGAFDVSGYYYITILNPQGKIHRSLLEIPKELINNTPSLYSFTGSLSKNANTILFSPPFGETIYRIDENRAQSAYKIDFGSSKIPARMRKNLSSITLNPMIAVDYSYLATNFYKLKNYLLFGFKDKNRMTYGIFDEEKEKLYLPKNAEYGPFKTLLSDVSFSGLEPVDEDTVALIVDPERFIDLRDNTDIMKEIKLMPELYKLLANISEVDNSIVLYFKMK
ncbi:MAG: 6-bladed beta-propeller [Bacteroidota bacterium]